MKIYSVLNLNFTRRILHKCVLITCELASLLLDALELVKELGYCTARGQISSGTNACKNTQTSLCSVVSLPGNPPVSLKLSCQFTYTS